MINSLDKGLWRHISILSTPLLLPSFDLGFEFVLRDVHATAEVAVDIICFKNNPGQGIEEIKAIPHSLEIFFRFTPPLR